MKVNCKKCHYNIPTALLVYPMPSKCPRCKKLNTLQVRPK